jgi:putative ABC transport system substrate-binding protein
VRPPSSALLLPLPQTTEGVRRIGWLGTWGWIEVAEHLKPLGWTWGGHIQAALQRATSLSDLPQIARDIIETRPDLIVTAGTPATLAVLEQTRTLPVIFFDIPDPVGNGIVSNLSRPSGNVTGFMTYEPSLAGKWVQMLRANYRLS